MTAPASTLTPTEAALRLGKNGTDRLRQLVQEGRLMAHYMADRSVGFLATDLEAILRPVPLEETLAALDGHPQPATTPTTATDLARGILTEVRTFLAQEGKRTALRAKWMNARDVEVVFGIDCRRLAFWVSKKLVRRAKFGAAAQAKSLYRIEDLDRVMDEVAAGRLSLPEKEDRQ